MRPYRGCRMAIACHTEEVSWSGCPCRLLLLCISNCSTIARASRRPSSCTAASKCYLESKGRPGTSYRPRGSSTQYLSPKNPLRVWFLGPESLNIEYLGALWENFHSLQDAREEGLGIASLNDPNMEVLGPKY